MNPRSTMMSIAATLMTATLSLVAAPALAVVAGSTSEVNTDAQGLAMHGYDPVAYFTDGAPTLGVPQFSANYEGARYQFANEADMKAFQANPAAYTPQFGGFCAMGASFGEKVDGDPKAWKIVNGKLYLNYNPAVARRWREDVPGNIQRADEKWPTIKDKAQ